jgi:hypothetical protein
MLGTAAYARQRKQLLEEDRANSAVYCNNARNTQRYTCTPAISR